MILQYLAFAQDLDTKLNFCFGKKLLIHESTIIFFRNPRATILKSEVTNNDTDAPLVASFSSRGPNDIVTDILKVIWQCINYYLHIYLCLFGSLTHIFDTHSSQI